MTKLSMAVAMLLLFPLVSNASDQVLKEHEGQVFYVQPPENRLAGGTGFLYEDTHGHLYVITNRHVCMSRPAGPTRDIINERGLIAEEPILGTNESPDLCLIQAPPGSVHGIRIAPGFNPKAPVTILGHPMLRPLELTEGYFARMLEDSFMTSARVEPGSSGSPMLNSDGELLGIVFAMDTRNHFSIVIPAPWLELVIEDYEAKI